MELKLQLIASLAGGITARGRKLSIASYWCAWNTEWSMCSSWPALCSNWLATWFKYVDGGCLADSAGTIGRTVLVGVVRTRARVWHEIGRSAGDKHEASASSFSCFAKSTTLSPSPPYINPTNRRYSLPFLGFSTESMTRLCAKNNFRSLAKDYLPNKFQVRIFIRSKDIQRYQKIRKWVTEMTFKHHSRSSGMPRFDRVLTISY